ncbi:MAG: DUF2125 domain-containing protein [Beijerinckiaceae bacterium]
MATREQRPSRRGLYLPFILLSLVALAWCAYWLIGAHFASRAIDQRIAAEKEKGREWHCANRSIEGFPFRFLLRCDGMSLTVGQKFSLTLPAFRAIAMAYNPRHVIAEADGPALFRNTGYNDLRVNWQNIQVSVQGAGTRAMSLSAIATAPAADEMTANAATSIFSAATFELHGRPTPGRDAGDPAIDIATTGTQVTIPMVASLLKQTEPGGFTLNATITKAAAFGPGSPMDNAERWRMAGGAATISKIAVTTGKIMLDGQGELALDEERRLTGRIAGTAAGLEQLLGVGSGGLGGLLNFGKPKDDAKTAPRGLPFAITLRDGRAQMGPIKFGNVPRLY